MATQVATQVEGWLARLYIISLYQSYSAIQKKWHQCWEENQIKVKLKNPILSQFYCWPCFPGVAVNIKWFYQILFRLLETLL
jgi:hypothetical protein